MKLILSDFNPARCDAVCDFCPFWPWHSCSLSGDFQPHAHGAVLKPCGAEISDKQTYGARVPPDDTLYTFYYTYKLFIL